MYNYMRRMEYRVVFFLALATYLIPIADCRAATNKINIPSTFTNILLTKNTVVSEILKCLPTISHHMLSDIESKFPQRDVLTIMMHGNEYFIISNTSGYCIQKSENNFPILAIEAFYNTANPPGEVPKSVTDKWYQEIATLIAQKGSAKVAYVFDNGNAVIVDYSVEDACLLYPHSFKKAGEWESEKLDLRFSDKRMKSFDSTEYNKSFQKRNLLAHRE